MTAALRTRLCGVVPLAYSHTLQVIRNISMWTFRSQEGMENPEKEYRERTLWDPLVEPLLDLATETESHELLVEVRMDAFTRGNLSPSKV